MASVDDYDKLSKEEREIRDKEDRAREATEQASTCDRYSGILIRSTVPSITVHMEARAWRSRCSCTRAKRNTSKRSSCRFTEEKA